MSRNAICLSYKKIFIVRERLIFFIMSNPGYTSTIFSNSFDAKYLTNTVGHPKKSC